MNAMTERSDVAFEARCFLFSLCLMANALVLDHGAYGLHSYGWGHMLLVLPVTHYFSALHYVIISFYACGMLRS